MPIRGQGWELHVERLGLHSSGGVTRTYGRYQVYRNGVAAAEPDLSGFICESKGPGANAPAGNGKRVEAGTYPIWTQFGRYRSIGYSDSMDPAVAANRMPGLLLGATNRRVGILIHPAHPPKLFLSSVGCFNPTRAVAPSEPMNFFDSRSRVIAMIQDLRAFAPHAFATETSTAIPEASVVVDGEPMNLLGDPVRTAFPVAPATPASLPISHAQALRCAHWLMDNYADPMRTAVAGKPYGLKHLAGIACQETAYKWLKWVDQHAPPEILGLCVFDASGDFPGTGRGAFPKNTAAFRATYGDAFTDMLIEEANKARRIQGWSDAQWVYKGYGLFQYDLQYVRTNRDFFENKRWYDFDRCLARATGELDTKLAAVGGDLWKAIKAYNGSGAAATQYAANVRAFTDYCAEVTG